MSTSHEYLYRKGNSWASLSVFPDQATVGASPVNRKHPLPAVLYTSTLYPNYRTTPITDTCAQIPGYTLIYPLIILERMKDGL